MTGRVYVVRHAKAGNRERWEGDDAARPISKPGCKQAEGLIETFRDDKITRIVSSPYVRCVETVEPLARARGLEIEMSDALAEGASLGAIHALIRDVASDPTVLCSHGDVIANLIASLAETGTPGADRFRWKKGSTWVLDLADDTTVASAAYLSPPA